MPSTNSHRTSQLIRSPKNIPVKKAKYKARALEHFRLKYKFSKEDWVLRLDEESEMHDRALQTTLAWYGPTKCGRILPELSRARSITHL